MDWRNHPRSSGFVIAEEKDLVCLHVKRSEASMNKTLFELIADCNPTYVEKTALCKNQTKSVCAFCRLRSVRFGEGSARARVRQGAKARFARRTIKEERLLLCWRV